MTRINLTTAYAEKDQAKVLGAKWDATRKIWYIVDIEDLTPFMRWIPLPRAALKTKKHRKSKQKHQAKFSDIHAPKTTGLVFKPLCSCPVPAWEHCEHTDLAEQQAQA